MSEQRSKRPLPARPEGSYHPAPSVDGVIAGGFIFLGALRGKGDTTEEQARSAFETLKSLLAPAGAGLEDVVRVTVYFQDMAYRSEFQKVWVEYFPQNPPVRVALGVANASVTPDGKSRFVLEVVALEP